MSSLPPQRSYQNTLVSLLSFLDGQKYHKNTVFPPERLAAISAEDLLQWMNYKMFGTPFPGPDANPTGCRSSAILFWKKSISFFIPNKHHPWDSLMEWGNPTRSREILDLIKFIKKKDVRRQGVPSQARRPLTLTVLYKPSRLDEEEKGLWRSTVFQRRWPSSFTWLRGLIASVTFSNAISNYTTSSPSRPWKLNWTGLRMFWRSEMLLGIPFFAQLIRHFAFSWT
jgi:hypothetical protein